MRDILTFSNILALSSYDNTNSINGDLAYVETLNDLYEFNEQNLNYLDNFNVVTASVSGYWTRLFKSNSYWKDKLQWFISNATGNDENVGSLASPLKTHDEFVRRITNNQILDNDYTVNVLDNLTGTLPLIANFSSGSISYFGFPLLRSNNNFVFSSSINYNNQTPAFGAQSSAIFSTPSNKELLVNSVGVFYTWYIDDTDTSHVTFSKILNANITGMISISTRLCYPLNVDINSFLISGNGVINFTTMSVRTNNIHISSNSNINFNHSSLTSYNNNNNISLSGEGKLLLQQSKLEFRNKDLIIEDLKLIASNSLLFGSGTSLFVNKNSILDISGTTIYSCSLVNNSYFYSKDSAFYNAEFTANSNSHSNINDLFVSSSYPISTTMTVKPLSYITYQPERIPKFDNIYIDSFEEDTITWSETPYSDLMQNIFLSKLLTSSQ